MVRKGRPQKDSKGVSFSIYAPRYEDYIYLKEKAKRLGVSLSTLIFSYIAAADERMAERIAEYLREVEERISELRKDVDASTIVRKIEHIELPRELEEDDELKNALARAKRMIESGQQSISQTLEWLVPVFERVAFRHGYVPESRSKVRMFLTYKLIKGGDA